MTVELRFLDRSAAGRLADELLPADTGRRLLEGTLRLREGTPLFMTGDRPAPFWFDYGLNLAGAQSGSTLSQYAHLTAKFARFLDERSVPLGDTSEADIVEYREWRRMGPNGISDVSWKLDGTILRRLFTYAVYVEVCARLPWFDYGRKNAVRQPVLSEPNNRGLTESEWLEFRSIGLQGLDPKGRRDPTFRVVWTMRNLLGAQLALTTGMRVQEFSSLLLPEIMAPVEERGGLHITLQAVAKGGRRRTIYIPSRMLAHLRSYVRTDRAVLTAHLGGSTHASRDHMFLVDSWTPGSPKVAGTIDGVPHRFQVSAMMPELRERTFLRTTSGFEPVALFVNSWGRMTSKSTWHRVFKEASKRVDKFPSTFPTARDVHPHTLRHTFARRYLAYLHMAARERGNESEWGEIDPLVIVQRALGHASLETTMRYVNGDSVSGLVEELFHLEMDAADDFAELIEQFLADRASV